LAHNCHWPGCGKEVPPKLWGCKPHWFKLPKYLRDKIWHSYRPGQETDKDVSQEYIKIAEEVQLWRLENE
jgi:hypothetical protein